MYQLVELEHRYPDGVKVITTFIPSQYAIPGLQVKFKSASHDWSIVWEVVGIDARLVGYEHAEIFHSTYEVEAI